jgi:hypothetical protein
MIDPELEDFKKLIDLRGYAALNGYSVDPRESSRRSFVMRNSQGDKVIISRKPDGVYTYWSPRDDGDRGTVIDFVSRRKGLNLGAIRKELRPFLGSSPVVVPNYTAMPPTSRDRYAVEMEFAKMQDAPRHPYLENERGIPAELLKQDRFAGRIRIDCKGNAVFPHFDGDGAICGFEKKNRDFTGFASGGTKALWLSHAQARDERLILCESAIDALSYAALFRDVNNRTRYASVGGNMSPAQPHLIRSTIARMPSAAEIVAAMDNDDAGRELAAAVEMAFHESRKDDQTFRGHEPVGFKDWNEMLLAAKRPRASPVGQLEAHTT